MSENGTPSARDTTATPLQEETTTPDPSVMYANQRLTSSYPRPHWDAFVRRCKTAPEYAWLRRRPRF